MRNAMAMVVCLAGVIGMPATAVADPASCLPAGVDLSDTTPFVPTAAQRKVMRDSYSSPEVAGLTTAISRYLAGTADKISTSALRSARIDDQLHEPYVLLSDDRNIMGGFTLVVLLPKTYDTLRIWEYRLGTTNEWQVRDVASLSCDAKQRGWIRSRYGALARDVHSGFR